MRGFRRWRSGDAKGDRSGVFRLRVDVSGAIVNAAEAVYEAIGGDDEIPWEAIDEEGREAFYGLAEVVLQIGMKTLIPQIVEQVADAVGMEAMSLTDGVEIRHE